MCDINKSFLNSFFIAHSAHAIFCMYGVCLYVTLSGAYSKATFKYLLPCRHVQGLNSEGHTYLCNDKTCVISCVNDKHEIEVNVLCNILEI